MEFQSQIPTELPKDSDGETYSSLEQTLQRLTFVHPYSRFFLELISAIFLACLCFGLLKSVGIGIKPQTVAPAVLITIGLLTALLDLRLFSKPHKAFSVCKIADLKGKYSKALKALELVGPKSNFFIRLPEKDYCLMKAGILSRSGQLNDALQILNNAKNWFVNPIELSLAKYDCLVSSENYQAASKVLQDIEKSPINTELEITLEKAMLLVKMRSDWFEAKQLFKSILKMPIHQTRYGLDSDVISQIYIEVCNLKTGHAETGLEGLSIWIENLKAMSWMNNSLKSTISQLLLQKAHYLVTHSAPLAAQADAMEALSLCKYPEHLTLAKLLKDELSTSTCYL